MWFGFGEDCLCRRAALWGAAARYETQKIRGSDKGKKAERLLMARIAVSPIRLEQAATARMQR